MLFLSSPNIMIQPFHNIGITVRLLASFVVMQHTLLRIILQWSVRMVWSCGWTRYIRTVIANSCQNECSNLWAKAESLMLAPVCRKFKEINTKTRASFKMTRRINLAQTLTDDSRITQETCQTVPYKT
jgi:hypothetical protein